MFFSRFKAAAGVSVSSQLEDSSSDQSLSNDRLVHRFDSQQGLSSPQVFYERRNDITFKVLGLVLGLVFGLFSRSLTVGGFCLQLCWWSLLISSSSLSCLFLLRLAATPLLLTIQKFLTCLRMS